MSTTIRYETVRETCARCGDPYEGSIEHLHDDWRADEGPNTSDTMIEFMVYARKQLGCWPMPVDKITPELVDGFARTRQFWPPYFHRFMCRPRYVTWWPTRPETHARRQAAVQRSSAGQCARVTSTPTRSRRCGMIRVGRLYVRMPREFIEALAMVNLTPAQSRLLWAVARVNHEHGSSVLHDEVAEIGGSVGLRRDVAERAYRSLVDAGLLVPGDKTTVEDDWQEWKPGPCRTPWTALRRGGRRAAR